MKILFVTSNRIGDAVLSTGLLAYLIERYPKARITIACGPEAAPLFAATPGVERVIALAKESWARHWLKLWLQVVTTPWGLVVDLRASALGHFLVARRRRAVRPGKVSLHQVVHLAGLFRLRVAPSPKIWIEERHRAQARRLIPEGGPVLAIGPTANWGGKVWPAASFAAAIARLTGPMGIMPDARVALLGGPGEEAMAAPVLASLRPGRAIDLVGQVDLLTAYACLERMALYVGNDSALMHLAAASGVPTLGLFGPSQDEIYGPWGLHTAVVRTPASLAQIRARPDYDYRLQHSYMASLTVDAVVAAAELLWRDAKAAA